MNRNSKVHVSRKCTLPFPKEIDNLKDDYQGNLVEIKENGKTIYMTPEALKRREENKKKVRIQGFMENRYKGSYD